MDSHGGKKKDGCKPRASEHLTYNLVSKQNTTDRGGQSHHRNVRRAGNGEPLPVAA